MDTNPPTNTTFPLPDGIVVSTGLDGSVEVQIPIYPMRELSWLGKAQYIVPPHLEVPPMYMEMLATGQAGLHYQLVDQPGAEIPLHALVHTELGIPLFHDRCSSCGQTFFRRLIEEAPVLCDPDCPAQQSKEK